MAGLKRIFPDLGDRTLVMGILNITPDSFADGGSYLGLDQAVERARAMQEAGVDVIDIGGESSRPGADPVSSATELDRVLPVIESLARHGIGPISIDTTKSTVARRALAAGAHLVNDISAMRFDEEMASVVAAAGAPVVLSHTRGRPKVMQDGDLSYAGGVVSAVCEYLASAAEYAGSAGVQPDAIMLDPGIGFGKTVAQNIELMRGLNRLKALSMPVLVGTSRKSFIGAITGRAVEDRGYGSAASVALAVAYGADMVRVHDVAEMIDVVRVADAFHRAKL